MVPIESATIAKIYGPTNLGNPSAVAIEPEGPIKFGPVVQIDFLKGAKVLSFVGTYYFNLLLAIFLTRVIEINKQS